MIQNIYKKKKVFIGGIIFISIAAVGMAVTTDEDKKFGKSEENARRLCHLNENTGNYNELYINANAWNGHADHVDDIWDVTRGACPQGDEKLPPEQITNARRLCHFNEVTEEFNELYFNANAWNAHRDHQEDIWDVDFGTCPAGGQKGRK